MEITEKDKELIFNMITCESFLVLGSKTTKHPFIVWDKDTFEDTIYVYLSEERFKEDEKKYRKDKYPMVGIKVDRKIKQQFCTDLYSYGVSQVVIVTDTEMHAVEMEKIIPRPDFSKYPETHRPLLNPELMVSLLYFLQEFTRDIPMEEKANLKDLEEEMAVNIARAKYLLPIRMTVELPADWDGKLEDGTFDIPYLTNKEGEMFLPVFSDVVEFNRFNAQGNLQATMVPIEQIRAMIDERCQGAILNPASFGFRLTEKTLESILKKVQ